MNEHQELAIRALRALRSDDTAKAKAAFRDMTPKQMQEQHGKSGMTRAEILAGYEANDARIDAAIAWVQQVGT